MYYSELQADSIHSNLFLVHLATLPFKRPPKQPDKLIICSAMFYCYYLRKKEKIFLVYPLRTGVMGRRRLITLPDPFLYAFMALLKFMHTREVEINKMTR